MTEQQTSAFWRYAPIGVLITIFVQGLVWLWWMASFAAITDLRLTTLEQNQAEMRRVPERLATIETQLALANTMLAEIRREHTAQAKP